MRILQIVLPASSEYERKCQSADREALSAEHEVIAVHGDHLRHAAGEVAHVYAGSALTSREVAGVRAPYVSSADLKRERWTFRRAASPAFVVSPLAEKGSDGRERYLPEAVESRYFEIPAGPRRRDDVRPLVGLYIRESVRNQVEQTRVRVERFRDDVAWRLWDAPPAPEEIASVDVWIDPAVEESDLDGFVAEALVVGRPVVATRTRMNSVRLEQGSSGFLVPPRDPNEMTHAILTALFKPEVAESRVSASRRTIARFKARQRTKILLPLYRSIVRAPIP